MTAEETDWTGIAGMVAGLRLVILGAVLAWRMGPVCKEDRLRVQQSSWIAFHD